MANALEICRICMSVNNKLFPLKNTNMKNLYKLLTHVYVDTEDGKPTTVCFLCYARLRQCKRLQQQAIKSNKLLEQLLKGGFMRAMEKAINGQYSSQDLQVSSTYHLDLEPANCVDVSLDPKLEDKCSISVKEEAIDEGCRVTAYTFLKGQYSSQDLQVASTYYLELEPMNCGGYFLDPKVEDNELISVKEEAVDEECNATENPCLIQQETEVKNYSEASKATPIQQSGKTYYNNEESKGTITEKFKCNKCDKQFATEDIATDHIHKCVKTSVNVRGDQLTKTDTLKSLLSKMYCCDICSFKTYDKHCLVTHLKMHNVTKKFSCNICEYRCACRDNLQRHIRTYTDKKPFSCNICEYRCAYKGDLKKHMRTHTGEKPISCDICDYRCGHKGDLKKHMRTHTGEKPFSCNICEYRGARNSELKKHMRTHTGEKPFSCNICDYRCAQKAYIKIHMRTHTGEKPFSCNMCEYRCVQKSYLRKHLRIHN